MRIEHRNPFLETSVREYSSLSEAVSAVSRSTHLSEDEVASGLRGAGVQLGWDLWAVTTEQVTAD